MEMRGVLGGLYGACEWVVRLAFVNILWIGFSLLGGIVLGLFPATVAMFSIARKWIQGETDLSIFQSFWEIYRKEFFKSNVFGLLVVMIGAILVTDIYIFYQLDGVFAQVLLYLFIAITFNYGVMLLYIFPVYVHYDLKIFQNFKYALIIGMSNPFHTFSMILCLVFVYFALEVAPASFLFLSIAALSLMYMVIAHRIFMKIEQKKSV